MTDYALTNRHIDHAFSYIAQQTGRAAAKGLWLAVKNFPVHREQTFNVGNTGFLDRTFTSADSKRQDVIVNTDAFMILRSFLLLTNSLDVHIRRSLNEKFDLKAPATTPGGPQRKLDIAMLEGLKQWYNDRSPTDATASGFNKSKTAAFINATWQLCDELEKRLILLHKSPEQRDEREALVNLLRDIKRRNRRLARENGLTELEGELPNLIKLNKAMRQVQSLQIPYLKFQRRIALDGETKVTPPTDYEAVLLTGSGEEKAKLPEELRRYQNPLKGILQTRQKLIDMILKEEKGIAGEAKSSPEDEFLRDSWLKYRKFRGRRPSDDLEEEEYEDFTLTLRANPLLKLALEHTYDYLADRYFARREYHIQLVKLLAKEAIEAKENAQRAAKKQEADNKREEEEEDEESKGSVHLTRNRYQQSQSPHTDQFHKDISDAGKGEKNYQVKKKKRRAKHVEACVYNPAETDAHWDAYLRNLTPTSIPGRKTQHAFSQTPEAETNPEWGRQYAWIPQSDLPTTENAKRRKYKKGLDWGSFLASIIIAIGEGLVAGFFGASALISWGVSLPVAVPLGIIIGISGATCNYFLFRSDSFQCIKDLFYPTKRFFVDKHGVEVNGATKVAIVVCTFLSIAAGVAFGIISWTSTQSALIPFLATLGVAATVTSPGVLAVAIPIAVISTAALATVFYVCVVGFFRNKQYNDLARHVYNRLIAPWVACWKGELSFLKAAAFFLKGLIMYTIGVALAITVVKLTLALGADKAMTLAKDTFGWTEAAADIFATALITIGSCVVNGYFYVSNAFRVVTTAFEKFFKPFNPEKHAIEMQEMAAKKAAVDAPSSVAEASAASAVTVSSAVDSESMSAPLLATAAIASPGAEVKAPTPVASSAPAREAEVPLPVSPFAAESWRYTSSVKSMLLATAGFNAGGQGSSIFESHLAASEVQALWSGTGAPALATQVVGGAALAAGSYGGNGKAICEALKLPEVSKWRQRKDTDTTLFARLSNMFARPQTGATFAAVEAQPTRVAGMADVSAAPPLALVTMPS